jgi:hypothetical protein
MADVQVAAAPGADTPGPAASATESGSPQSSGWQALFQDEALKTSKSLARYKSLDDAGRAYLELETQYRTKAYEAIPGEDATPEARTAFFKKLPGYPESADKYSKRGLDIPAEAGSFDEAAVSSFLQGAHAKGLTNDQVGYVLSFYESFIGNQVQGHRDAASAQINEAYGALKERWGAQTDLNLLIGDEFLRRTYGEDAGWFETLVQRQDGKAVPLRNVPEFIDMAFQLGRLHGHDKFVVGNGAGGAKTPEQSQQAISEARARYSRRDIGEAELTAIIEREGPNAYREGQRIGNPAAGAP